jgi:hypothetical protein
MKARARRLRLDGSRRAEHTVSMPETPRSPLGSLDGPSRTIRVEPVETPVTAPPPRVEPEPPRPREPVPPAPARSASR